MDSLDMRFQYTFTAKQTSASVADKLFICVVNMTLHMNYQGSGTLENFFALFTLEYSINTSWMFNELVVHELSP